MAADPSFPSDSTLPPERAPARDQAGRGAPGAAAGGREGGERGAGAGAAALTSALAGWGRYELGGLLGRGGMVVAAERRPVVEVVYEASSEIRGSIVYATLIILLVFLPLFFLSGVEGRLLRPLAVAYGASLGASLLVALTVTPALCALLLGRHDEKGHREVAAARWVTARYEPLLRRASRAARFRPRWPSSSCAAC